MKWTGAGNYGITVFLLLFSICVKLMASPPALRDDDVPPYDYSQTRLMVLYGEGDYVLLGNPFENPGSSMGTRVYEIILLYASQLQPFTLPVDPPVHVLDLMMTDKYGQWRLGQRLYLGDPWLSDGKAVSLMKPADYQLLKSMLDKRYATATAYSTEGAGRAKRPAETALPEGWLTERESVEEAIKRLPASSHERNGYDPGAQLRRKRHDDSADEVPQVDKTVPVTDVKHELRKVSAEEAEFIADTFLEPPVAASDTPQFSSTTQEPASGDNTDPFIIVLLLAMLIVAIIMLRRRRA